ncbi:restriction endonuclease subunit S [Aeromonas sanarellii]
MSEVVVASQQTLLVGKYKPYSEYRDSGIVWFGKVPIAWSWTALKRVVSAERPITYGIVQAGPNIEDGIPYVRPTDMTDEDGIKEGIELLKTSDEIAKNYRRSMVDSGDIICSIGPSFGKLMIVPDSLRGANLTQGTARVAIAINHDTRYFFWCLRSLSSYQQWESSIGGATFRALNLGPLADTLVPLPPIKEQSLIAAFLDYETARIDRLIAQQQRLIELLIEKRQAVISHAVTKGLNPDAPMKDSGVEWLGQVPKHWIVAGFKKYIEPIVDYRGKTPTKTESGVFLVTARNIKNGSIDYHLSEEFISEDDYEEVMRRGKPKLGDVLFTTEAPLGEVAQVDNESIALAQRIIKFRGLRDILDCSYLKLFIQSTEFQHGLMTFATGSTALGIKSDRLGYLKQLVPPISEQTQIVEVVAKHAMQFGKLIDIANKAIQLMQERRTALISAAVTGKIDLRGWTQPAEEVAA